MTRNEYASLITQIIDQQTGGIDYPDSFESDIDACFVSRMDVDVAAEKLQCDWSVE